VKAVAGQRKLIGVWPASAARRRRRLLAAVEEAFPVSFEGIERGSSAHDGLIAFGAGERIAEADRPSLLVPAEAQARSGPATAIEFATDARVARPLRGRTLRGHAVPPARGDGPQDGDAVLASCDGRAAWWARAGDGWSHVSTFAPHELGAEEVLRDQLSVSSFMALVPLLHLVRHVCAELGFEEQPLRASFVIDDPNLHWPSYGYLDYAELVRQAHGLGYHVGFATVPADGWMTNGRAAALVRDNPSALSLLIHGNDHAADELGRLSCEADAELMLAQALRRADALERRSGVTVQRVMVPPHEACSMAALKALCRLGFEAACIGRRHPWKDYEPAPPAARWPLLKWHPTDLIDGALPILPRYLMDRPREELALRALLGQPLIVFGHHWDFAEGLDLLAETAAYVNGLGDVQWGPASWIARNSFQSRREGTTLHVRVHARKVAFDVPEGVELLRVEVPRSWGERRSRIEVHGVTSAAAEPRLRDRPRVEELRIRGGTRIGLELVPEHPLDRASLDAPGWVLWPATRRALVAARDRTLPLRRRLSLGPTGAS
jgi:hypothetical protein